MCIHNNFYNKLCILFPETGTEADQVEIYFEFAVSSKTGATAKLGGKFKSFILMTIQVRSKFGCVSPRDGMSTRDYWSCSPCGIWMMKNRSYPMYSYQHAAAGAAPVRAVCTACPSELQLYYKLCPLPLLGKTQIGTGTPAVGLCGVSCYKKKNSSLKCKTT